MRIRFSSVLRIVLPILAFFFGFYLTDWVFRVKLVPFPFEWFGVVAGLGLASGVIAFIKFFKKGDLP